MKQKVLLIFFVFLSCLVKGQQGELEALLARSKAMYVTPDVLDRVMISLRPFEENPPEGTEVLIMQIFTTVSSGYMANNHFKQAYLVYRRYLDFKEKYYLRDKQKSIALALQSVNERSAKDKAEQMDFQNQVQQLQIDNDVLSSKSSSFKTYSIAGVILLTALFAGMLVNLGVRLNNFRSSLKGNRERIRQYQRIAQIGRYAEGLRSGFFSTISASETQLNEISAAAAKAGEQHPAKKVLAQVNRLKEIIRDIRTTLKF